jgi:hypothetical protein
MADFFIPSEEETTINMHNGDVQVKVDISHVQELLATAYDEAEKIGASWTDHFSVLFKKYYDINLSRTAAMMLVSQSKEMFDALKKSSSQSPSSTKGTRSRSPKS